MMLVGLATVIGNLNKEVAKIHSKLDTSMLGAGLFIQAEAQRRTPVDTGNLKASARTLKTKQEWGVRVTISFGTDYAIQVHEVKTRHSVGDWKFLERAIMENFDRVLKIIREGVAIR